MTYAGLLKYKKDRDMDNRGDVLKAVRTLRKVGSFEIYHHINLEREDGNRKQERAHTDYRGFEKISDKEKKPLISYRTVQRHLKALIEEGLVIRKENLYSLSQRGKTDVKYFGNQFGSGILNNIINQPDFKLRTVKENLRDLVTIFGSYIVSCCMEAVKPTTSNKSVVDNTKFYEDLESKMSWINSAINPTSMLHLFLFTFLNQQDDDIVKNFKRVKFTGIKKADKFVHVEEESGQDYELDRLSSTWYMYVDKQGRSRQPKFYRDIPNDDDFLTLDKYNYVFTDHTMVPFDQVSSKLYHNLVREFEKEYAEIWKKIKPIKVGI